VKVVCLYVLEPDMKKSIIRFIWFSLRYSYVCQWWKCYHEKI